MTTYKQHTICRSCGDIIKTEKKKSDKGRTKDSYSIMPPQFCRACEKAGAKHATA